MLATVFFAFTMNVRKDASYALDVCFQTPASEIMEKIVDLHHDLMFFLVVIVLFVS